MLLFVFYMIEFWTSDSVANDVFSKVPFSVTFVNPISTVSDLNEVCAFVWTCDICSVHLERGLHPLSVFLGFLPCFLLFFPSLQEFFFHLTWSEALKTDVLCPDGKAR